jgi:hypothetical protein
VADQSAQFYRSALFVSVMNYVNRRQGSMTVKQTNNKLSLTVKGTTSVDQAIDLFSGILAYHESTMGSDAN